MQPLRILITNHALANRAGSEMYAKDLAIALLRRGHHVVVYSTVLGDVASDLRLVGVPVVDDLRDIAVAPDVIHGHHHLETMTAVQHFPSVPALYVCHGFLPWEETPPTHPRIVAYVAVDQTGVDRLTAESGISPAMIEVVPNFVDLERFRRRPALPEKPARALIFCNDIAEEGLEAGIIRRACQVRGITLDIAGTSAGNVLLKPEEVLPQYDLAFARGRSALEALAAGLSVVLCAVTKHGPLVTRHNADDLYRYNFGLRTLHLSFTAESVAAEIEKYDAADSAAVTDHIRNIADSRKSIDRLESLYQRVSATEVPVADEQQAVAGYLRWLSLSIKGKIVGLTYAPTLLQQVAALGLERVQLVSRLAELRSQHTDLENVLRQSSDERERQEQDRTKLKNELQEKHDELERERLSVAGGEQDRTKLKNELQEKHGELQREHLLRDRREQDLEQELQREKRLRQWREEELLTIRRSRTFQFRDSLSSIGPLMRLYRALRR